MSNKWRNPKPERAIARLAKISPHKRRLGARALPWSRMTAEQRTNATDALGLRHAR